jgi:FKBP-type peptidyl-prolyl cis-trans isomerase
MVRRAAAIAILCGMLALCATGYAGDAEPLQTDRDRISYSIGMDVGLALKRQHIDADLDVLLKGLNDSYRGAKTALTEQQARQVLAEFRRQAEAKQQETRKKLAEKNRREGDAFRAEYAKKEGVVTLPSGLQYKVLKAGSGRSPTASDSVTVKAEGHLLDGTKIESVYEGEEWMPGDPLSFEVTTAIPGWKEALLMMKTGARWQLVMPPNLAYGDRGDGRNVGPGATLTYELELLSIEN